jgi:hypothetical protein
MGREELFCFFLFSALSVSSAVKKGKFLSRFGTPAAMEEGFDWRKNNFVN